MGTVAEISGWITIRDAIPILGGITVQRVHQLIEQYGAETMNMNPRLKMVRRVDIERIAKMDRPNGLHADKRRPTKTRSRRPRPTS